MIDFLIRQLRVPETNAVAFAWAKGNRFAYENLQSNKLESWSDDVSDASFNNWSKWRKSLSENS